MSLHRSSQIPFQCPRCASAKGFPIGLAIQDRTTVVAVIRCKKCEHLWQVQRQPGERWPARTATTTN